MEKKPLIKPYRMALEVTGECRFLCRHCQTNTQTPPAPDLDTNSWLKILTSLAHYTKCTTIFTGGEPLERSDFFDLLDHARSLELKTVVATCGYLIDESTIGRLQQAGVSALSLSIDGASAETHDKIRQAHGSFEAVLQAAQRARQAGLSFQVNTTLNRLNRSEVIAIANLTEQIGAACFNPFVMVPKNRDLTVADQLLDPVEYETLLNELLTIKLRSPVEMRVTCGPQLARIARTRAEERVEATSGCLGGREFGFISRQGDVRACGFLDLPAGNLVANGFDFRHIWEESQILRNLQDRQQITGKCSLCDYLDFCGGCRARAFLASDDYLGEDPLCQGS